MKDKQVKVMITDSGGNFVQQKVLDKRHEVIVVDLKPCNITGRDGNNYNLFEIKRRFKYFEEHIVVSCLER